MAIKRFAVEKYASLEINRAAFTQNGQIVSQSPLGAVYTKDAPCENGMWVDANIAVGEMAPMTDKTKSFGIVFSSEKEYNPHEVGLKYFHQVAGEYPRVGVMQKGDIFTTNCFCYDDGDFADDAAVKEALAGLKDAPLYLVGVVGEKAPKLVKEAPAAGLYAQVVKPFTVPNGEYAIKYTIVE